VSETPASARVLVDNVDGRTTLEDRDLLVCSTSGGAMDHVVKRVTAFAFVVSAVVATLALSRVAPAPIGGFAAVWLVGAFAARAWSTRRLREHGRFTFDFERRAVTVENPDGRWELQLDEDARVERTDDETPGEHLRWLLLRRRDTVLRLARGTPDDLGRVLYVLRKHGVRAPTG